MRDKIAGLWFCLIHLYAVCWSCWHARWICEGCYCYPCPYALKPGQLGLSDDYFEAIGLDRRFYTVERDD